MLEGSLSIANTESNSKEKGYRSLERSKAHEALKNGTYSR